MVELKQQLQTAVAERKLGCEEKTLDRAEIPNKPDGQIEPTLQEEKVESASLLKCRACQIYSAGELFRTSCKVYLDSNPVEMMTKSMKAIGDKDYEYQ